MNKTAIKNFAIWARNKLIADIQYRAGLMGITAEGIKASLPQSTAALEFYDIGTAEPYSISGDAIRQRDRLVEIIRQKEKDSDYPTAYKYILEEVAYTWFNRLIAIRFMEVNDYLPSHIRVLSSESGKVEPDLVTSPFDAGLDFSPAEEETVLRLKTDNQLDELFRLLFVKQCNALSEILPALFEPTSDYTELLLNLSVVDQEGVVYHLVHDIVEDDFNVEQGGQVEIIGWLYQYYNTEPKNAAFAKSGKITKEEIPAVTQLFTPDWIVRYMVENSLGRLWLEGHPNDQLRSSWRYYLDEAEQEPEVEAQLEAIRAQRRELNPQDIQLIDPCMGSGHILVYAFEVLMQIYESQGWSQRDAAQSILEHNLYGLDIDDRAAQLAYFAVMMKARQYDRRILTRGIQPNLYSPHGYADGQEFGSLLTVDELEPRPEPPEELTLFDGNYGEKLNAWNFRRLLAQQYDVVVTNPPYMGSGGMNGKLSDFVKSNFPDAKGDLFACFIERGFQLVKPEGFLSVITMESWMFLSSFEKLRQKIISSHTIINMVHMPYLGKGGTSLGINFGTAAVVFNRRYIGDYNSQFDYIRYYETDDEGVPLQFPTVNERYKAAKASNFSNIPGSPVAYWVSSKITSSFSNKNLDSCMIFRQGMTTTDNEKYLRKWYEVSILNIGFGIKNRYDSIVSKQMWFPYQKGGEFRRWYGNHEYVVFYYDDGKELIDLVTKKYPRISDPEFIIKNRDWYFKIGLTWSTLSSGLLGVRFCPGGFIFDAKGSMAFTSGNGTNLFFVIALLNSVVAMDYLDVLAPTMDFNIVALKALPIIERDVDVVNTVASSCTNISKIDWDSYETSWDFKRHPLI